MTRLIVGILLIAHCIFVFAYFLCGGVYFVSHVYGPSLELHDLKDKEGLGQCGPTTDMLEDLIVDANMSEQEAYELARVHGSAIVPSVLSEKTASIFREYVLDANEKLESAFVLAKENRHRITPPHTEPIVQHVFKEIFQHETLRPLIDSLAGPEASLIAFSVITSKKGAEMQGYHPDTTSSSAKYPDLFVPEYTLAIALQNTTRAMGATGLCPGTHVCEEPDFDYDAMEKEFRSNKALLEQYEDDFDDYVSYNMPCKVFAEVKQGDALLYNTDMFHTGGEHTDELERAQLFITLASTRQGPNDNRHLPHGKVYSLDWKMWGQTLSDLTTIQERPWRVWHTVGLFNGKQNIRPWTLIDAFFYIYQNENGVADFISNELDADHMRDIASMLLVGIIVVGGLYVALSLPFFLIVAWYATTRLQAPIGRVQLQYKME